MIEIGAHHRMDFRTSCHTRGLMFIQSNVTSISLGAIVVALISAFSILLFERQKILPGHYSMSIQPSS